MINIGKPPLDLKNKKNVQYDFLPKLHKSGLGKANTGNYATVGANPQRAYGNEARRSIHFNGGSNSNSSTTNSSMHYHGNSVNSIKVDKMLDPDLIKAVEEADDLEEQRNKQQLTGSALQEKTKTQKSGAMKEDQDSIYPSRNKTVENIASCVESEPDLPNQTQSVSTNYRFYSTHQQSQSFQIHSELQPQTQISHSLQQSKVLSESLHPKSNTPTQFSVRQKHQSSSQQKIPKSTNDSMNSFNGKSNSGSQQMSVQS